MQLIELKDGSNPENLQETLNRDANQPNESIQQTQEPIFGGQILLNNTITRSNFLGAQIQQLIMALSFTVADTLQPMIFLDKNYYGVPKEIAGTMNSKILSFDLPLRMLVAPLYGTLCDHFGRLPMLIYGTISLTLGFITAPFHETVIPGYLISRLLFINGGVCILVLPFNADYVHDSTKGRAAGIAYTAGAFGALAASMALMFFQILDLSLGTIYIIFGLMILIATLINSRLLKRGNMYYRTRKPQNLTPHQEETHHPLKLTEKIASVFEDIGKNKWILIAFLLSLLGSADFYIVTTIFVLFIKSFYPSTVEGEDAANKQATAFQGIFFTFGVIFCIMYGFLIDRLNHFKLLLSVLGVAALSFWVFTTISSAEDLKLYAAILLASLSLPGVFTFASFSAIKHFPSDHRGILMGMSAIFGVTGVVIVMIIGGYLFDSWSRNGPYILYFGLILLTMLIIALLKITGKLKEK